MLKRTSDVVGLRCCRQFADGSVEETQLDYGEFVEGVVALTCFAEPNPYTHTHCAAASCWCQL